MKDIYGTFQVISVDAKRRTVDTKRVPHDGNIYTLSCPPGPLPKVGEILILGPEPTVH